MSFDHALYYPWIDIQNSEWLKTAILYWGKISTIVPETFRNPYQDPITSMLSSEKILVPYKVDPFSPCVFRACGKFMDYLETKAANTILQNPGHMRDTEVQNSHTARIYTAKLAHSIREELVNSGRVKDEGEYLSMNTQTANYYMNLLAVEISEENRWGLLTDAFSNENLTNQSRRGDSPKFRKKAMNNLTQGLFAEIALQSIKIAPNTPLETILDFRVRHAEELLNFRRAINDLTLNVDPNIRNVDELRNYVSEIYTNSISPKIELLKKELTNAKIRCLVGNLVAISFIAGELIFNPSNSPIYTICKDGTGIIGSVFSYVRTRRDILQRNPWSFVLSAQELQG